MPEKPAGGMDTDNNAYDHLDRAGRMTARAALSSRIVTYMAVAAMLLGSWYVMFAMAAKSAPADAGPVWLLPEIFSEFEIPAPLGRLLALCLAPATTGMTSTEAFAGLTLMWFLMSVAMMLPSAAPLIRTYCEIADTAKAQRKPVVHPLWLVAGYLFVWLAAAAGFAAINWGVAMLARAESSLSPIAAPVSAGALALAGLYQFSGLKEACLTKCRNPFATLFANWSGKTLPIFVLGMRQGIWCLGCCWALMLVMFAVGVMNIFWMTLLAVFTVIEKSGGHASLSRIAGALLLVWALAVILFSL